MEEVVKNSIPCETCEYYLAETNECEIPQGQEKPCKDQGLVDANVGLGTLYDLNKQILSQLSKINIKDLKDKITTLAFDLFENNSNGKYYMLLNNENKDYTLFNFSKKSATCGEFREDLLECLNNRGEVISLEKVKDQKCVYEIWLRIEEEMYCYYFFPYDIGVLEY